MSIDEIADFIAGLAGVLVLEPQPGDGSPEISWGDRFFYYAPDGVVPKTQPFATIVTKDYPGDDSSRLDRPGAFRVNFAPGRAAFAAWTSREPDGEESDPSAPDTIIAHPVYGDLGWLAVVNPGPRTRSTLFELLRTAYDLSRSRSERRAGLESD